MPFRAGNTFIYSGNSMRPRFRPGDELHASTSPFKTLKQGDIVVFTAPAGSGEEITVHRIVRIQDHQILTRGDNNLHLDLNPLTEETYLGKVTAFTRGNRTRQVSNGCRGWVFAGCQHVLLWLVDILKWLLRPLYHTLRTVHLRHPIWQPALTTLIVQTSAMGSLLKTLHRGRTVARYWLRSGKWQCQKPFDLVIASPRRGSAPLLDNESCREQ
jgi:hypothetical protein